MDFEELFDKCASDIKYDEPKKPVNIVVENLTKEIENTYRGHNTAFADREKEKKELVEKIATAEKKLSSIKNPQNTASMTFARREAITKKLAEQRRLLRQEIGKYKVRLDEIKIEEGDTEEKGKNADNNAEDTNDTKINSVGSKWDMNPYSDFL